VVIYVFILEEAVDDLEEGKDFYHRKEFGVGEYFWDSLISRPSAFSSPYILMI